MTNISRLLELARIRSTYSGHNFRYEKEYQSLLESAEKAEAEIIYLQELNNGLNYSCDILEAKLKEIEKLGFHTMPIPQDSTSFAQFTRKQNKLKEMVERKE